ncbi:MAG: DoxX family protein [Acidimicrobiales bacterium]
MTVSRRIARPMLASMFVAGGVDAVQNPESKAKAAESVAVPIAKALKLPEDPTTLVRINGGVQVGAGVLLALGVLPRISAAALAGSLVPTTLAGHHFWDEADEDIRRNQRIHFLKNMSMLGGLIIAAIEPGGRPSQPRRARRAAGRAGRRTIATVGRPWRGGTPN